MAQTPRRNDGPIEYTSKIARRLAWIGEGLLGGVGIHAMERFESLAIAETKTKRPAGVSPTGSIAAAMPWLAQFEAHRRYSDDSEPSPIVRESERESPAGVVAGTPPPLTKKRSRFLNFWAKEVATKYLKNVYQDEERDEMLSESGSEDFAVEALDDLDDLASTKLDAFFALERKVRPRGTSNGPEPKWKTEPSPLARLSAGGDPTSFFADNIPKSASDERSLQDLNEDELESKAGETPKSSIMQGLNALRNRTSVGERSRTGSEDTMTRIDSAHSASSNRSHDTDQDSRHVNAVPMSPLLAGRNGAIYRAITPFKLGGDTASDENGRIKFPSFGQRKSAGSDSSAGGGSKAASEGNRSRLDSFHSLSGYHSMTAEEEAQISSGYTDDQTRRQDGSDVASSKHSSSAPRRYKLSPLVEAQTDPSSPVQDPSASSAVAENSTAGASSIVFDEDSDSSMSSDSQEEESVPKNKEVVTALRELAKSCDSRDLSEASIQRISTLLATMRQIVADDKPATPSIRSNNRPQWTGDELIAQAVSEQTRIAMKKNHRGTNGQCEHTDDADDEATSADEQPGTETPLASVVSSTVMTSMATFESAQNLFEILAAFQRLLKDVGMDEASAMKPLRAYRHIKAALYDQLSFRQKALFRLLDNKLSLDLYHKRPCRGKRVCVVGSGPCGLRAAVELALMGAHVVVIEQRKHFSREHILHLWPWVVQDLTSLGAKMFFPAFCHSTTYFHVGTRQLQCILLKVALLMGVMIYPGTTFQELRPPALKANEGMPFYTVVTQPQIPVTEFTAVLGACGLKDKVSNKAGIKRFVYSRRESIGLVCYFPNTRSTEEKRVNEFSWNTQNKHQMFAKLREAGIDLENIVYYRGEVHCLCMTARRQSLLDQGVLKVNFPAVSEVVVRDNVDDDALRAYATRVIDFLEIAQKADFLKIRLFDFSSRIRASPAAKILTFRDKKLYVSLLGDALLDSFWPDGVGTCRGFLSAMDACWMVAQIDQVSDAQLLADRELGYRIIQHISGNRHGDLRRNVRKYNVDPASRYKVRFPAALAPA